MEIIKVTKRHLDSVYLLICELEDTNIDKAEFKEIFNKNIGNKNVYYFIAKNKTEIVGFVSIHINKLLHHTANIAEIQELIVTKRCRGKSIGQMLLKKAKEVALENDCMQLEVCCNMTRTLSHEFYEKQGLIKSHYKFTLPLK